MNPSGTAAVDMLVELDQRKQMTIKIPDRHVTNHVVTSQTFGPKIGYTLSCGKRTRNLSDRIDPQPERSRFLKPDFP